MRFHAVLGPAAAAYGLHYAAAAVSAPTTAAAASPAAAVGAVATFASCKWQQQWQQQRASKTRAWFELV